MTDMFPKLPEGVTRKDLGVVYVMALEEGSDGVLEGGCASFDDDCVKGYNVWVDDVRGGINPVDSLEKEFLATDKGTREQALAQAREYAWLLAAKYLLDVEEY